MINKHLKLRSILLLLFGIIPIICFGQKENKHFLKVARIENMDLSTAQSEEVERILELNTHKAVYGLHVTNISKVVNSSNAHIPIKLPGSNSIVASPLEFDYESDDDFIWYGEFKKENGDIWIARREGRTFGNINIPGRAFEVRTIEGGITLLIEIDLSKITYGYDMLPPIPNPDPDPGPGPDPNPNPNLVPISVILLYTENAETYKTLPGLEELKVQLMNQLDFTFNQSLSNMNVVFNLVAFQKIWGFEEVSDEREEVMARLEPIANSKRNFYNADIAILLTCTEPTMPTYAYRIGVIPDTVTIIGAAGTTEPMSAGSYAIVETYYAKAPTYTFAHEVGHLFGAGHEHEGYTNVQYANAHGFEIPYPGGGDRYRIIMHTGYLGWQDATRLNRFSNPNILFDWVSTGEVNESDNARQIEDVAIQVSNFQNNDALTVNITGPTSGNPYTSYTWTADVVGGDSPYSYYWQHSTDGITYSYLPGDTQSITGQIPAGASTYYLKVTVGSNDSQSDTDSHIVWVDQTEPMSNNNQITPLSYLKTTTFESSEEPETSLHDSNSFTIYPNPAEGFSDIYYNIDEVAMVKIDITDLTGRRILTMQNGRQDPGNYKLKLESSRIGSGLYLCTIQVGVKKITKRLIIQ